ncbi:MAG: pyridoxal-phosphate-dependent aminotransferase family protein [Candidatus Kariarchaeaceae archaeon]|jgi:alanine-glyoxylate transaminase/serine-glyoxylate transaminase/serine-pyruvate transaminase
MTLYNKDRPLLMIPGPVEVNQHVLNRFTTRSFSHTEKEFISSFSETLKNLRTIFASSLSSSPVVVAGAGTLAMEMAMVNLIDKSKNQKALICDTGYFGIRFETIAQSFSLPYSTLRAPVGQRITMDELNEKFTTEQPDFAFIQHVDTSTGVANDIEAFGKICQKHGVVSVVDGVCALGGMPLFQEKWGIDIYFTGAQKALAVPPGLAIMMYSEKAKEISLERKEKIPSYYADLTQWWPILEAYENMGVKYFSTPATNLIMSLHESTKRILEEGLNNRYVRHEYLAKKLRESLGDLGYSFITASDSYANTLSTPKYLDVDKGAEFRNKMLEQGILIAGGIQSGIAPSYFRIGHMGEISNDHINYLLNVLKQIG